jgi:DnaK suppressor protein
LSNPSTPKNPAAAPSKTSAAKKTSVPSAAPVKAAAKKALPAPAAQAGKVVSKSTPKPAADAPTKTVKAAPPASKKAVATPPQASKAPLTSPSKTPKTAAAKAPTAAPAEAKSAPPPAPTPTPVSTLPPGLIPSTRKSGRGASKYFVAPLPAPTSRVADRFAPPRPPTRQMQNLEVDTPRQVHKADPKLANAWKSKAGRELTEPELLAMPEAEYMNEKQLDFFKARLQALKDDLLSNAGETTEHLREDTSIVPDPADRATIEEEHALELRTRDRERKLLKKISQSLGRLESGEYGFCDETGEPIGLGRLIARPTATLSLEAQQRRELKQKMFGD